MIIKIKTLFTFILLSFMLTSCKEQDQPPFGKPGIASNYDINITRSNDILKRELGKNFVESYVSKNQKNIFVQIKSEESDHSYSLLQYDITQYEPKFIKTIVDQNMGEILWIYPLQKNKIIYVRTYKSPDYVRIYDYVLQKEIRAYNIYSNNDLEINPDEMSFTKGGEKVDISDIYKDILPSQQKISRDDVNEIVVDSLNNLTWQDDISVVSDTYSLEDAINICKIKPSYNWRLPTIKDMNTLMTQQSNPFSSLYFKNIITTENYYWLQSIDKFHDDSWVYDATDTIFIFSQTYGRKHVRCVTDVQSD